MPFETKPVPDEEAPPERKILTAEEHSQLDRNREWLVENFLSDLLKERAEPGLIAHGPVTMAVDERASRSFALPARRYSRVALSNQSVTGPSLVNSTCMCAPKVPV